MGNIAKNAGLKNSKFISKKGKKLFTIDTLYANMYVVKIGLRPGFLVLLILTNIRKDFVGIK